MAQHIYIDESGSITKDFADEQPYFIIALVRVFDRDKLRRVFKRFISSNFKKLKTADKQQKMFDSVSGKFLELKGNCLTLDLKDKFLDYFSKSKLFEVYYIKLDNHYIDKIFSSNKARCFNYLLKSAITYYIHHKYLPKDEYYFHIDERNIRTEAKYTLEDYLNTELLFNNILDQNIKVEYYDSCNSILIQIADVFANIFYSNLLNGNYEGKIKELNKKKIIKQIFKFPYYE